MNKDIPQNAWKCPCCSETIPGDFDRCWNCGAQPNGTPDPDFQPEDQEESDEVLPQNKSKWNPFKIKILVFLLLLLSFCLYLNHSNMIFPEYVYNVIWLATVSLWITFTAAFIAHCLDLLSGKGARKSTPKIKTDHLPSEAIPVCPHCLTPNDPHAHFCVKCTTPLTSHSTIDPIKRIHSTGDTYRKALKNPANFWVLLGAWLLFGPQNLFLILYFPNSIMEGNSLVVILFTLGLIVIYSVILYKVTRNYFLQKNKSSHSDT